MKKAFVLDTNILLNDPDSIFQFEDNDVIIPIVCIQEIDKFKRDQNERGRNARAVSRHLDQLRLQKNRSLADGVELDQGGALRVELGWNALKKYPYRNGELTNDDRILAIALELKETSPVPLVFLTRDTNLRIRADAIGLNAQDYNSDHIKLDDLYPGIKEIYVPGDLIDQLYQNKEVDLLTDDVYSNEFILFRNELNPSRTGLGRVNPEKSKIVVCGQNFQQVWGIIPRNLEQRIALELLMDDKVSLVTLIGRAGTGKTLLALAAGLCKSVDERKYRKLLVSRPIFPLGRDLGFLPGELSEKLKPWMQPIFDNLEMLFTQSDEAKPRGRMQPGPYDLIEQKMIEVEALTYIRGRSIPNQYFIVDEAQNLTPHEIKTIITRAGHGTKIILTGDPYQIDNPYLDSESSGLTHVVEKFKGQPFAGHVTLLKGERSLLAQVAADLL